MTMGGFTCVWVCGTAVPVGEPETCVAAGRAVRRVAAAVETGELQIDLQCEVAAAKLFGRVFVALVETGELGLNL
jgi:hypothetical protein